MALVKIQCIEFVNWETLSHSHTHTQKNTRTQKKKEKPTQNSIKYLLHDSKPKKQLILIVPMDTSLANTWSFEKPSSEKM